MIKHFMPAALLASVMIMGCSEPSEPKSVVQAESEQSADSAISAEEQRLNQFFADSFAEDLARRPFNASYLGI